MLALGIGTSAILFSKRWIEDSRESLEHPAEKGSLTGYRRLYAPYLVGRRGDVIMWFVRLVGALLVCAGVIGFYGLLTQR